MNSNLYFFEYCCNIKGNSPLDPMLVSKRWDTSSLLGLRTAWERDWVGNKLNRRCEPWSGSWIDTKKRLSTKGEAFSSVEDPQVVEHRGYPKNIHWLVCKYITINSFEEICKNLLTDKYKNVRDKKWQRTTLDNVFV